MLGLVVETESSWFDYVSAAGTILAVVFAAYAAIVAHRSARAAIDLVKVESDRDARAADDAKWRYARRVALDLRLDRVIGSDPHEHVFELGVWNTSSDPILKPRLKVIAGNMTWGPQLVGTIGPGERSVLTAVLAGPLADDDNNVDGFVFFKDVEHREWVASVRNPVRQAVGELDQWIADGRRWVETLGDADDRHIGSYSSQVHGPLPRTRVRS